VLNHKFTV